MPKAKKTSTKRVATKTPSRAKRISRSTAKMTMVSMKSTPKLSARERAQKATTYLGENIKKPRVFIPVIVIIVLILLFLFKNMFVVALVNGQPVFRMAYQQQLEAQAGKQVMSSLVTQSLLEQEAARRGITVSQTELDAQLRTIQAQLATQGQTLDSALAAQGLSQSSFMQQLRLQALVQKMLADKITVSDTEISDYISKNQATLPTGETDAQIKAQVKQQLSQQKLSQQAQLLVQQLQSKAHITYFINL